MSKTYRDNGTGSKLEKHSRKYSSRKVRVSEREFCTRSKYDDDAPLKYDIAKREPGCGGFYTGYWRPMRRWLNSHIGDPWNQVYSDLIAKMKIVSSNNEEAIRQYILGMVDVVPNPNRMGPFSYYAWDFYVDDNGVLQRRKNRPCKVKVPKYNVKELANWLHGKVIGKVGNKLFWFTQVVKPKKRYGGNCPDKWKCRWRRSNYYGYDGLEYLHLDREKVVDKEGNFIEIKEVWKGSTYLGANLRQDRKLTTEELDHWNKIPKYYQDKVLQWSPTYH